MREFGRLLGTGRHENLFAGLSRNGVTDAACGPATLARTLIGKVKRVYAVDLCKRMIDLTPCSPASGAQVLLTVGDVEQLPYASKSFQLVVCAYAFANFSDPLKVLREFIRVLDDKGRIAVLEVIAPEDPLIRSGLNLIEGLRGDCYTRILDRSQFTELFRVAGLRLESSQFHHRYQSWREWLRLISSGRGSQACASAARNPSATLAGSYRADHSTRGR